MPLASSNRKKDSSFSSYVLFVLQILSATNTHFLLVTYYEVLLQLNTNYEVLVNSPSCLENRGEMGFALLAIGKGQLFVADAVLWALPARSRLPWLIK